MINIHHVYKFRNRMEAIEEKKLIIETARLYLNKKERPGNSGFEDPEFEKDMIAIGWIKGYSWCALFAKLIFCKCKPGPYISLFDPGAVRTFNNFKKAKFQISLVPVVGCLVIWQHYAKGVAGWHGHAGICSSVINNHTFTTIEGNTSVGGSSNGDRVFEHTRTSEIKINGLNILGFVII